MPSNETIAPQDAINALLRQTDAYGFLDVRAEGEWRDGHIEGFSHHPILTDNERHLVGTCYKLQGSDAATTLGYELTASSKNARVQSWQALQKSNGMIVNCWRGGARSRIACEWLNDAGVDTHRVWGGYKSMRAILRETLATPPELIVLSGVTGSGKTLLLRQFSGPVIDLEKMAQHRGSAFGGTGAQPSQQTFENRLALSFLRYTQSALVEDESRLIGRCEIPKNVKQKMYNAPVVELTASIADRLAITYEEYVAEPLRMGVSIAVLQQNLQRSLDKIKPKLGGTMHKQLTLALSHAMSDVHTVHAHEAWITPLLLNYYDPQYRHAFHSRPRHVLFSGHHHDVLSFVREYFCSPGV